MWGVGLGGAHSLVLILHLALLGLFVFWEVPVHIVYGEQCPGEVVTVPGALESRCFGGKSCVRMEVSECACQYWEIIHVVDNLPCCLVGIEILDVSED